MDRAGAASRVGARTATSPSASSHGIDRMTRERLYPLRHHPARRAAEPGRRLLRRGQGRDRPRARRPRHRLCRGRLARRQPDRQRLLRRRPPKLAPRNADRLRHDQAPRPLRRQRRGAGRRGQRRHAGGLPRRQDPRLPRHAPPSASRSRRTSPTSRDSIAHVVGAGPRGDLRRRAFLRRLEGQPRLRARLPARPRSTPARAGSCSATPTAARCPHEVGAITARGRSPPASPASGSASTPTTTPATRWRQHARRRRRRRAPDPGHAQRPRRALRQRQPRRA